MIKPIGDRVLVKPDEEKMVTSTGVIIPDNESEKPLTGVIVSVSDELSTFTVGERVYYPRYTGAQVECEGIKYLIIKAEDVMGKDI